MKWIWVILTLLFISISDKIIFSHTIFSKYYIQLFYAKGFCVERKIIYLSIFTTQNHFISLKYNDLFSFLHLSTAIPFSHHQLNKLYLPVHLKTFFALLSHVRVKGLFFLLILFCWIEFICWFESKEVNHYFSCWFCSVELSSSADLSPKRSIINVGSF